MEKSIRHWELVGVYIVKVEGKSMGGSVFVRRDPETGKYGIHFFDGTIFTFDSKEEAVREIMRRLGPCDE